MTDALDIPSFLDRRHEIAPKGTPVTEQPKKKPRKATLRLVVECAHEQFDMAAFKSIVEKAKEHGTVKSAKLSGLPSTTDLS